MNSATLPAEWHKQSLIQLTWPHENTDWAYMLEEVEECFKNIAFEIMKREKLLIVTPHPEKVKEQLKTIKANLDNLIIIECETNDTWARDHSFITMLDDKNNPILMDFCFNGWGMKFAANLDNRINREVYKSGIFNGKYVNNLNFILEGGSIESDGKGTLLTTSECLLSSNRNDSMTKQEIESYLKETFSLQNILWLNNGYLAGDDTDSHVDTLARLCPNNTIVYVKCNDKDDEHYEALKAMEDELKELKTSDGKEFRLLALPMNDAIYSEDGERLPATYANFLIINGAVLYPTYNQAEKDNEAANILKEAFPDRDIIGINCIALIKQHGSLHCVTMQYPEGVINNN